MKRKKFDKKGYSQTTSDGGIHIHINTNEVRKHSGNKVLMRTMLDSRTQIVKPKKGKGSFSRKQKHKGVYGYQKKRR